MERHADAIARWNHCPAFAEDRLESARLELHWAVQPIAAVGQCALDARPDDSHTALGYVPEHRALVGQSLADGRRFGLGLVELELIELVDERVEARRSLIGQTLAQAYGWVGDRLKQARRATSALTPPDYGADGLASAPVSTGAAFDDRTRAARRGIADWFSNASLALESMRANEPAASAVRCWPHHFDIATLLTFDPEEPDAERARSCGLGLSPGDNSSKVPYLYVGPWPRPSSDRLPQLEASKIFALDDPREQAARALAFLESGLAASKELLGV